MSVIKHLKETSTTLFNSSTVGEKFKSLINSNCEVNRVMTVEAAGVINSDLGRQMSRKTDEIKLHFNTHIF